LNQAQINQINQARSRATTWLIPRKASLSPLLCGEHEKLAVRVTNHPEAKAICEFNNSALVSTSCNLSGRPEMKTMLEVRNKIGTQIEHLVNGICGKQKPSQIIDLESGKLLRR